MSKEIGSFSVGASAGVTGAVEVVCPPSVSPSLLSSDSLFNFSPQIVSEGSVRVPLDSFVPIENVEVSESGGVNRPDFELAPTIEVAKVLQDLPVETDPPVRAFNSDLLGISSSVLDNEAIEVPSPLQAVDFRLLERKLQFNPMPDLSWEIVKNQATRKIEQPLSNHKLEIQPVSLPRVEVEVSTPSEDMFVLRRLNEQAEQKSLQQVRERLGRLRYIKDEKVNSVRLSIAEAALNQLAKKAKEDAEQIDISKLELPAENPSVRSSLLVNTPDNSYLQARSEVQHSSSPLFSTLDQARRSIMSIFLSHSAVDVGFSGEAASVGQVGEVVSTEELFANQDLRYLVAQRINKDEKLVVKADLEEVVVRADQSSHQHVEVQCKPRVSGVEDRSAVFELESSYGAAFPASTDLEKAAQSSR